jgi:uncharacterized protein (TIGR00369 family)
MSDLDHIQAIPWCAKQLSQPNLVVRVAECRSEKADGFDRLFGRTLRTAETLQGFVVSHPRPPGSASASAADRTVPELRAFITLGRGLNGFAGVCHGGIVTTLLDETMGQHIVANQDGGAFAHPMLMTAYLNTRFLAPVETGRTVAVVSRLVDVEGRKYKFEAAVEDEKGRRLAECDALFVAVNVERPAAQAKSQL